MLVFVQYECTISNMLNKFNIAKYFIRMKRSRSSSTFSARRFLEFLTKINSILWVFWFKFLFLEYSCAKHTKQAQKQLAAAIFCPFLGFSVGTFDQEIKQEFL